MRSPQGDERRFVILNAGSQVDQIFTDISDIVVLFDDFWDCGSCVGPSGRNCSALDCMQWSPAAGAARTRPHSRSWRPRFIMPTHGRGATRHSAI